MLVPTSGMNGPFMKTELQAGFGEMNFSHAQLGDRRRTARLVRAADAIARHPGGSLSEKLKSPAELEGLYHLMTCPTVTHETVLAPHCDRTLQRISAYAEPVLVIHDTTELDFTTHRSIDGLGQIGNGSHRGWLCHNSLAVDPSQRHVLGLTGQILHRRAKVRKNESQPARRKRKNRESRLWLEGTQSLPADWNIVDVCDRGADTFEFLEHAFHSGRRFVIRSAYNRSVYTDHCELASRDLLHDFARTLGPIGEYTVLVRPKRVEKKPKKTGKKKIVQRSGREAVLHVAAAPILLRAPYSKNGEHGDCPLPLWIVRVWEMHPPQDEEPLEWFLLTNQPIVEFDDARQIVRWYECRWIIEEYHKAMKTGCGIENPQFTSSDRLQPMIALLSVVALALLNLRELSRHPDAKHRPATDVLSAEYVTVLSAWRHGCVKSDWTIHDFCYALARLGGHLNRKNDHPPGWLILWRGWTHLQAMLDGTNALKKLERCA